MGADGSIYIVRDDRIRELFPDCDELFAQFPNTYCHELDGVKYWHCYAGDYMPYTFLDPETWYGGQADNRVHKLSEWLYENGTEWEVWT